MPEATLYNRSQRGGGKDEIELAGPIQSAKCRAAPFFRNRAYVLACRRGWLGRGEA